MTEDEHGLLDRTIPVLALQAFGLVCLLTSVAVIYDGWYVVGALGVTFVFGRTDDLHDVLVLMRGVARRRRRRREDG